MLNKPPLSKTWQAFEGSDVKNMNHICWQWKKFNSANKETQNSREKQSATHMEYSNYFSICYHLKFKAFMCYD